MATRQKPTKAVEHQVRDECGQACANPSCRQWSTSTHELHHIDEDRSNSVEPNLLLLCANCHSRRQAGVISQSDIIIMLWKRMAEAQCLPPLQGQPPPPLMRDNYGVAGQSVHIGEIMEAQGPDITN